MRVISSKDNKIIKEAASLAEKKYREKLGLYLLEGPNIVKEAMEEGGRLRFIFTKAGSNSDEILQIASNAEDMGLAVYELTSDVFARISDTDNPQGIIAVAEKIEISEEDFFKTVRDSNILVLDKIQDPGNMGTLLRTCEAMGFGGVILVKGCTDVYAPKVVRSSAGSMRRLPVICVDEENVVDLLKRNNKTIYAATMDAAKNCYELDLSKDVAIVIGNEGNGVSNSILANSNGIKIPMAGRLESLNAAMAAGMIMYESFRQSLV